MRFQLVLATALGSPFVAASSKLFWGATIVAFDEEAETLKVIRNGALLVTDDRIAGLYDSSTPDVLPEDTERIDVSHQIITPGFIDTHRHGWQTVFKTLGSNTTLAEYLDRYGPWSSHSQFTARDIYLSQLTGLWESLNGGVTTSLDHAHHIWSYDTTYAGINATIESGGRVFWGYTFQNVQGYGVPDQIPTFREIAESNIWNKSPAELCIAYDGWGLMADGEEIQQVVDLAREYKVSAITTHSLGGPWVLSNMPSVLHKYGILAGEIPIVFSHASFLDSAELALLRQTNQYFSITPESEMHYGHTNPKSHIAQDRASLGVDTHFTFSADILTQARLWLQTVRYRLYDDVLSRWQIPTANPMTVAHAFQLATRSGGLALRRPDLGVIKVGAKADILVWNARGSPSMLGWVDPVAAVMLHANVGDILDVVVDGKFVKRNGKMLASNYEEIRDEFIIAARRIQRTLLNTPYPVSEGKFFGVSDYGRPQDIDTHRHGPLFLQNMDDEAKSGMTEKEQLTSKDEL